MKLYHPFQNRWYLLVGVFILCCFMAMNPIEAAVTVDGAASSNSLASGISITFPHTTGAGTNRLMLVGVSWNSGTSASSISSVVFTPSVGSDLSLSPVVTRKHASQNRYSAIYSLLAPPSGVTGTVTVTFGASISNGIMAGAANFTGVHQTTSLGTTNGADGQSTAPSVALTGLVGDELVFDNVFQGASASSQTLTVGANQTQLWNPTYVANLRAAASIEQATSSSVTMSWTAASSSYWVIVAVPINPAPVGTTYDLTMAVDPTGGGTTTPSVGSHTYPENTVVNLSATAAIGYDFDHWEGDVADANAASTTVTMTANKTVTAHFVAVNYDLTIAVSPSGSGTTDPAVGIHSYGKGSVVNITATPATGYLFENWTGDVADVNSMSTTITMDEDQSVTANFIASPVTYLGDIGSNTIKNSSEPELVVTTTAAVVAGDAIIIAYATDPSQDLNIAITDDAGNLYQQAAMAIGVGSLRTYIFAAYNVTALASGSSITITQTVYSSTAVAARAAVVSVFRGLAPSGALEQSCVSSGTGSSSPSSGAATTVQNDQLLIGAIGTEGPGSDASGTWSNLFTAGPRAGTTATTTDAEITISMGWRVVTSAGSYTAAKSGITSRDYAAAIATFKTNDAGISFIGEVGKNWSKTAGTSLTVTTNAAVSAGDDILLVFAADEEGTVSSVTDGAGNTYELAVQIANDATGAAAGVITHIYAAYNVAALASGGTITINHTSVTARSAVVSAFRGLASSSVVDQTKTATGSAAAVSTGATGTTAQADELLIGAIGLEGPNVDAPSVWQNSFSYGPRLGTSFGASSGDATDITAQMGWRIVGATGAYTAQIINLNTARDWAAAIATFKYGTGPTTYALTVNDDGHGTVTLSPSGGTYTSGTTVTLTPVPNPGYGFSSWSGDNAGELVDAGGGSYTIVMNGNKTVTANFVVTDILGDVNDDDEANSTDALIVLSCDVGIDASQHCPMNCGDVNSDGVIDSTDALIILSYDVDLSVPYPVGQPGCPETVTPCEGCNP